MIVIDGTVLVMFLSFGIGGLFVWLFMAQREPYIHADGWNKGYERGIEQGMREAAEEVGGPPAPIRIEMSVR